MVMAESLKRKKRKLTHNAYTVGWVCVLRSELNASRALLDEQHEQLQPSEKDDNSYLLGRMGNHNVVITFPGSGTYGTNAAAQTVANMIRTFRDIRFGLMVGVGGGSPRPPHPEDPLMDIRLGDVVVSNPKGMHGGVLHYDMGKWRDDSRFDIESHLNKPPKILLKGMELLQSDHDFGEGEMKQYIDKVAKKALKLPALKEYQFPGRDKDLLFRSSCRHVVGENCSSCDPKQTEQRIDRDSDDPVVHYGLIASGNSVMRSAHYRDKLRDAWDVSCFEMEAAGLMDDFPCIVIRGICDYSDDHKTKLWQPYSAVVAAAYAKDLLRVIQPEEIENAEAAIRVIKELQKDVSAVAGMIQNDQNNKILDWIAPPTYKAQHIDISSQHQPGTGQWFLNSPEFAAWIQGNTQTLFCPGIPGAGKTIMASIAIEHLRSLQNERIHLFLYCNYRRQEEQTTGKLLAMLLRQVAEKSASMPESVQTLYTFHGTKGTAPSCDEIFTTLSTAIGSLDGVFIVIDALDECSDKTRTELLMKMRELQRRTKASLLATSRHIGNIEQHFAEDSQLEIRADEDDVGKYINSQLGEQSECVKKNHVLREKIKTCIAKAAEGMFLLARLNLDSLKDKMTELEIEEALGDMQKNPANLRLAYDGAVKRIDSQAEGHRKWAHHVLSWLLYARRPLTSVELQHALAIRPLDRQIELKNLPNLREVISLCAGLVTINHESRMVELVHYTTQEFFKNMEKELDWIHAAPRYVAAICITYLSFDVFETGFCSTNQEFAERLQSNVLYGYAAHNWGYHACAALAQEEHLILSFLNSKAKVSACSQAMLAPGIWSSDAFPKKMTGEHLAAYFGLTDAVRALHKDEVDPDPKDSYGRTALSYAAERGHEAVVKLLLAKNGVDINSKDSYKRTPLSYTAERGHETVIKLLLTKDGVDPDSKDSSRRTPLSYAAQRGHETVIKLLLAKDGVDPDSKDSSRRTPLSYAAQRGHETAVKLLLAKDGVDPDSKNSYGRTALSYAAEGGHEAVIELLTKNGVGVNSKDPLGRTALSYAAKSGHEAVVNLLTKVGVDSDSKDSFGRTALSYAAEKGHEAVVKLLTKVGVDSDSKDSYGRTALSYAADEGHEAVVKLLLEKDGVDPDSKDFNRLTPLSYAVKRGHEAIVKLLLAKNGVDPNSKNSYNGGTALSYAAEKGHEAVFKLLLAENGVDLDSKNSNGRTPLSLAAERGHEAVVKLLLLKNQVDPDSKDFYRQTPLSLAAINGHETIVKLLLAKNGINPNTQNLDEQTPLSYAAERGHETIVKLLLAKNGIDVNSKDSYGQTPLSHAAKRGRETVVKLLLAKNGVDLDSKDSSGQTPLSYAAMQGHETVVKLLQSHHSFRQ